MADTNDKLSKLPISSENEKKRPLLKDINHFLTCILCDGYFFNATTIIECYHTYCRACIFKFLQTEKYCPTCEIQVHRTKPYLSLRHDATKQRLVYKMVPGLYNEELKRRYYYNHTEKTESDAILNYDDWFEQDYFFFPDEPISISLEYIDNKLDNLHIDLIKTEKKGNTEKEQVTYKKYLNCPARVKIRHIYKFIKYKFNLKQNQKVEILYDNAKLPGTFSLMDVAYTFSWKGDSPMRLCYQILESTVIQIPQTITDKMSHESVSVKNDVVTKSASQNNMNNVQNSNEVHFETTKNENFSNKVNLKRKPEIVGVTSNTKDSVNEDAKVESKEGKDDAELLEPSVKIPRISNTTLKDIMDFKKDGHEDKPKPTATVSPCTENGLKLPLKSTTMDDFNDDYMKYEQDIEEVEDDDDDEDDDRLRISQLSEEDTQDEKCEENSDQNLVIETSDFETKEEEHKEERVNGEVSKKSAKYKRKSKKSKHSHHHKHHRHHDRKSKGTPQATILHSPDTDIMKLKLKLNNVKPEVKYHKQRRKRKKSAESYFSSSFSSSSSVSSASGMSPDTHTTSRADEDSLHSHASEISAESVDASSSKDESPSKNVPTESAEKYQSSNSKEKLLQMRAFRPRNIAVVKPEENHKLEKRAEKPKNDNNNNDNTTVMEIKEKPKPMPTLLRPPSSITVSKITAAEKQKMEQEKLMMMNGNGDDKPSLEIMLVNGPPSSSKSFVSPVSSTTDVTTKPKTPPRQIRPPPAAIPLVQYQKMKSVEQTLPKSLTITPQIQRSKSNETLKKPKDTQSTREGVKRSVTVSLSGNPFEKDFGVLDLSGKSPKYPETINVPQTLLNKKLCMNGIRAMQNGMSNYSPVKCMSTLADNVRQFHKITSPNRLLTNPSSPKHKIAVSSPQTSPKPILSRSVNAKSNKPNVPNLNEIKIGPVSSTTEPPPKPGPNQTVRQIPNPSIMLQRHQATVNNIASPNCNDFFPIKLPNSTSIMNHRIGLGACSFNTLKKASDKCPPAIPLKGFRDISTIMATK